MTAEADHSDKTWKQSQLAVQQATELYVIVGQIATMTRQVLATGLRFSDRHRTPMEQARLETAINHLNSIREGFVITLRASSVDRPSELRDLVRRVLIDWSWLEALGLSWIGGDEIQRPVEQVLAFAHSLVALGLLPHLPPEQITFPQPPRYDDIAIPHTPGEILARLEELELVIEQAIALPVSDLPPEPLRRTYGFFEASAWLVQTHLKAFHLPQ